MPNREKIGFSFLGRQEVMDGKPNTNKEFEEIGGKKTPYGLTYRTFWIL